MAFGVHAVDQDQDQDDEDFPDDGAESMDFKGPKPTPSGQIIQSPSPVSVYVIRLLEILLGVETVYRCNILFWTFF